MTPPVDSTAVVDLLGVLAYAELTAFDRLAEDARLAPTLGGRAALARMAAAEIGHHGRLTERLTELGVDPAAAMNSVLSGRTATMAASRFGAARRRSPSEAFTRNVLPPVGGAG